MQTNVKMKDIVAFYPALWHCKMPWLSVIIQPPSDLKRPPLSALNVTKYPCLQSSTSSRCTLPICEIRKMTQATFGRSLIVFMNKIKCNPRGHHGTALVLSFQLSYEVYLSLTREDSFSRHTNILQTRANSTHVERTHKVTTSRPVWAGLPPFWPVGAV